MEEQSLEPGEEPGTWTEDFMQGPIIVEEVQHPEDWDPETHGDIPSGKGSPPASYFRRLREEGKGMGKGGKPQRKGKGKDEEDEIDEEGGGKKGGKKGRSVRTSHGDHGGALGLTSSPSSSQTSIHGKGSGSLTDGAPHGCGGKGNVGHPSIYVTPYGTKFHTQLSCRSLMRSQNLAPSTWCRSCMRENEDVNTRD